MLEAILIAQLVVARTLEGDACAPWAKVEVLEDRKTRFVAEDYLDATAHKSIERFGGGVVAAFGTKTPRPSVSLLHHAPSPVELRHSTPVLLLHGVGTDATLTWNAKDLDGSDGLVPYLVERGHRVFAVTFAVSHGDNLSHAIHAAHAIERVVELTGAKQVDVVAHSMGGLAARAVLTRLDPRIRPCADKVRRLASLGTPHAGLDLSFRHPVSYLWFAEYGFPSPWLRSPGEGDVTPRSIFSEAFRGHRQMTADLSAVHRLSAVEDHARDCYRGLETATFRAPGLAAAERQGGSFVRRLAGARLPPRVELYLVAGTDDVLRYYDTRGAVRTQVGEHDGPSDGLVFVASALGLPVFGPKHPNVRERFEVHRNHFELTYDAEVKAKVAGWLER